MFEHALFAGWGDMDFNAHILNASCSHRELRHTTPSKHLLRSARRRQYIRYQPFHFIESGIHHHADCLRESAPTETGKRNVVLIRTRSPVGHDSVLVCPRTAGSAGMSCGYRFDLIPSRIASVKATKARALALTIFPAG